MDPLHAVAERAIAVVLRRGPVTQGKIDMAWRLAVGPSLGRVAHATLRADGAIEVTTSDARWRREVSRSSPLITRRLRDLLGDDSFSRLIVH